jgi:hypothetical protein
MCSKEIDMNAIATIAPNNSQPIFISSKTDPKTIKENMPLSSFIAHLMPGDKIPTKISFSGEVGSLETTDASLIIFQEVFCRLADVNEPMFSSDASNWKTFGEYFTGNLSANLEANDKNDSFLSAGLHLQLSRRV